MSVEQTYILEFGEKLPFFHKVERLLRTIMQAPSFLPGANVHISKRHEQDSHVYDLFGNPTLLEECLSMIRLETNESSSVYLAFEVKERCFPAEVENEPSVYESATVTMNIMGDEIARRFTPVTWIKYYAGNIKWFNLYGEFEIGENIRLVLNELKTFSTCGVRSIRGLHPDESDRIECCNLVFHSALSDFMKDLEQITGKKIEGSVVSDEALRDAIAFSDEVEFIKMEQGYFVYNRKDFVYGKLEHFYQHLLSALQPKSRK